MAFFLKANVMIDFWVNYIAAEFWSKTDLVPFFGQKKLIITSFPDPEMIKFDQLWTIMDYFGLGSLG
jgi:hypothetical protein